MISYRLFVGHISSITSSSVALILLLIGRVPCLCLRKRSISIILASISLIRVKTKEVINLLLLIIWSPYLHVILLEVSLLHIAHHSSLLLLHGVLLRTSSRLSLSRIRSQIPSIGVCVTVSRSGSRTASL